MNTFLDYLTVLAVFVILALPSLIWHAYERRIDRELARRGPAGGTDREAAPAPLPPGPGAPGRDGRRPRAVAHTTW
ncbi:MULTISPECIES: hypothetical protein [unclassified Streptomyces]|uniref:hypothetical protein n=1 Tax=unclassified Streptomyces TaxID=2593676 RepID=UPI002E11FC62|nr:hypothetical protein OG452_10360 [Streptomyces sp. NBC_01197]WSS51613.1 hypothetical protein OG708_25020 [Streptomyces sp. NBC_01180]